MKSFFAVLGMLLSLWTFGQTQVQDNAALLKLILTKYYANEKPIVKNRLQLLFFYSEKANNTVEISEGCKTHPVLKNFYAEIKKQIQIENQQENWNAEFQLLFTNQHQYLQTKVQTPVSLEKFQALNQSFGENNQRMLIVNKPIYLPNNYCLIKIGFYRSIEHNSGSFVLFQKNNGVWQWIEEFNRWET